MNQELQSLLERIQKEGVEKAETESARIIENARKQAQFIIEEANKQANAILEKSQLEAKQFTERARKTLEHAARDVVLTAGEAITSSIEQIVYRDVNTALDVDLLKQLIAKFVDAYIQLNVHSSQESGERKSGGGLEVLVSPEDYKAVRDFFIKNYSSELHKGIEIKSDSEIIKGFKVRLSEGHIEHDLTGKAIAEAISNLLRPDIAEIVHKSIQHQQ